MRYFQPSFVAAGIVLFQVEASIGGTILDGVEDSLYIDLAGQSEYRAVGSVH